MGKCYNTITVNAPIDKVWSAIRNFHEFPWAKGVVEKVEVVGPLKANQIGARRLINDAFHETLLTLSDLDHVVEYSIDDGPGPVAKDKVKNYIGRARLFPITADNTTFVEWTSTYDSPNDAAVGELCNPIYVALLSAMRDYFG
jgi:hypothetical protein